MIHFQVLASDPGEHRVKPSPDPPKWNSYLLRLVEKGGELDSASSITFTLHYGEVHSRHDRSASYRSAREPGLLGLLTRRNFSLIARASQSIQPFSCLVR